MSLNFNIVHGCGLMEQKSLYFCVGYRATLSLILFPTSRTVGLSLWSVFRHDWRRKGIIIIVDDLPPLTASLQTLLFFCSIRRWPVITHLHLDFLRDFYKTPSDFIVMIVTTDLLFNIQEAKQLWNVTILCTYLNYLLENFEFLQKQKCKRKLISKEVNYAVGDDMHSFNIT